MLFDYYRMTQWVVAMLEKFTVEALGVIVAGLVGGVQCWLIWSGLKRMETTGNRRDRQLEQQEKNADRRHEESMLALRTLIQRTAA